MSLRTKTSFLLAIIVTAALSITGVLYLRFLERSLKHSILAGLESVSITASGSIAKFLDDTLMDVRVIGSGLPMGAVKAKNVSEMEARLKDLSDLYPQFENGMFLLDASGVLWADYPPHPAVKGKSFEHREYFQRTMHEQRGIIGTPYRSARTNEPVLTFTALLRGESNEVLGILGCSVQLLHPSALGGIRSTKIGRSGYIYVYDSSRLMILHPLDDRVLQRDVPLNANRLFDAAIAGFDGVGETVNSRDVPMLAAIKHVPGTDWIVVAQQPKSEAFAPIREAERWIILGIVTAVLIAVLIGALAIRGITSPLVELREAVVGFGANPREDPAHQSEDEERFRRRLGGIRAGSEIGELAQAFQDLSERLSVSHELLRGSARDWERTFDSVADAILILDRDNRIVRLNHAAARLLEVDSERAKGRYCFELMHGAEKPPAYCPHRQTVATGQQSRVEVMEPRTGRYYELTTTPLPDDMGETVGSVHVTRDITEKKRSEDELRQSQERYRSIFETATVSIWEEDFSALKAAVDDLKARGVTDFAAYLDEHPEFVTDTAATTRVLDVNEATLKLYGAKSKDELLCSLDAVFLPESYAGFRGVILAIAEGKTYFEGEAVNRTLDGRRLDIFMSVRVPSDTAEFKNMLVSVMDITRRKQAERALKESEETTRALLDAPSNSAILLASDGTVLALNQVAAERMGKRIEDILGRPVYDFFTPELVEARRQSVDEVFRTGRPLRFEVERKGKTFEGIIYPVFDLLGKVARVAVFASDISERKELEEERVKTSKLEATGILAGGIAHDFNNILTAILGNISLAKMSIDPDAKPYQRLGEAEKASLRAKDLAQQLLTFSKGGIPIKKSSSVKGLIEDSARFALSGSRVRCELDLPQDLWWVEIDEGQINQVVNNLVINAVQAMPEGGTIRIRAENAALDDPLDDSMKPGNYVKISIEDQGVGILKEHLPKIFDPYFTTKQKGSGFGLATVHSIIRRHGGTVSVKSELGKGATFYVYLPALGERGLEEKSPTERIVRGKGRVLLMDDEEMVRDVGGRMLSFLGYRVELASEGGEAVELYRKAMESPEPFDAVIMDLTVPGGMGGREAMKQLLDMDPEAKGIVSSGYSNDPIMADFEQFGFSGVVCKPYRVDEMSSALQQVMSKKSGRA